MAEVCGLRTRMVRGSAKQTHLRTRTIRGSKATNIVCRTNLERKCQCTSSQQFENWSTFGHCSRPSCYVRKPVWLCGTIGIVYWIQCNPTLLADADGPHSADMSRHYSCGRGPSADLMRADADYPRTWNLWIRTPLLHGRGKAADAAAPVPPGFNQCFPVNENDNESKK